VLAVVSAEMLPDSQVPPLSEQVEVDVAQRRPEPVGVVDGVGGPARVGDLEAVREGVGRGNLDRDDAGGVEAVHRQLGAVLEDQRHRLRIGPPAPHDGAAADDVRA
jgi:hypothetical protein